MRLRVMLIALALVVLAFAGLRQIVDAPIEPSTSNSASGHLSAQPAPEQTPLPAVSNAVKLQAPSPTPLLSGWHRHLRPAAVVVAANRHAQRADHGADRPRTFPLLI